MSQMHLAFLHHLLLQKEMQIVFSRMSTAKCKNYYKTSQKFLIWPPPEVLTRFVAKNPIYWTAQWEYSRYFMEISSDTTWPLGLEKNLLIFYHHLFCSRLISVCGVSYARLLICSNFLCNYIYHRGEKETGKNCIFSPCVKVLDLLDYLLLENPNKNGKKSERKAGAFSKECQTIKNSETVTKQHPCKTSTKELKTFTP